jgi:hypothetical protein
MTHHEFQSAAESLCEACNGDCTSSDITAMRHRDGQLVVTYRASIVRLKGTTVSASAECPEACLALLRAKLNATKPATVDAERRLSLAGDFISDMIAAPMAEV